MRRPSQSETSSSAPGRWASTRRAGGEPSGPSAPVPRGDSGCRPGRAGRRHQPVRARAGGSAARAASSCCWRGSRSSRLTAACRRSRRRAPWSSVASTARRGLQRRRPRRVLEQGGGHRVGERTRVGEQLVGRFVHHQRDDQHAERRDRGQPEPDSTRAGHPARAEQARNSAGGSPRQYGTTPAAMASMAPARSPSRNAASRASTFRIRSGCGG